MLIEVFMQTSSKHWGVSDRRPNGSLIGLKQRTLERILSEIYRVGEWDLAVLTEADQMAHQLTVKDERNRKESEPRVEKKGSLVRDAEVYCKAPVSARKLGVIHECEPRKANSNTHDPLRHNDSNIPTSPRHTVEKYCRKSSAFTDSESDSSHPTDTGGDCAEMVLMCLFCRFSDLFLMMPGSCERASYRCCPAYKQFSMTEEPSTSSDCTCNVDFDCGLLDACQETGECMELAMELSEICYR